MTKLGNESPPRLGITNSFNKDVECFFAFIKLLSLDSIFTKAVGGLPEKREVIGESKAKMGLFECRKLT